MVDEIDSGSCYKGGNQAFSRGKEKGIRRGRRPWHKAMGGVPWGRRTAATSSKEGKAVFVNFRGFPSETFSRKKMCNRGNEERNLGEIDMTFSGENFLPCTRRMPPAKAQWGGDAMIGGRKQRGFGNATQNRMTRPPPPQEMRYEDL